MYSGAPGLVKLPLLLPLKMSRLKKRDAVVLQLCSAAVDIRGAGDIEASGKTRWQENR